MCVMAFMPPIQHITHGLLGGEKHGMSWREQTCKMPMSRIAAVYLMPLKWHTLHQMSPGNRHSLLTSVIPHHRVHQRPHHCAGKLHVPDGLRRRLPAVHRRRPGRIQRRC